MFPIAALLLIFFLVGAGLTVFALWGAPDGYEDDGGFHAIWSNESPDCEDVACIWDTASEKKQG